VGKPPKGAGGIDGLGERICAGIKSRHKKPVPSAVLRFLASGRKVVTSSYHGRIWATWLGRDVELDGPAAEQLTQSGPVPPLVDARRITLAFYAKAIGLRQ